MASDDMKALVKVLQEQQKQQQEQQKQQQQLIESLVQQLQSTKIQQMDSSKSFKIEPLDFGTDDPELFGLWKERIDFIFDQNANWDDSSRIEFMMSKLTTTAFHEFTAVIFPKKPKELSLSDTWTKLENLFSSKFSIIALRLQCFDFETEFDEDVIHILNRIKLLATRAKVDKMSLAEMVAMIMLRSLKDPTYKEFKQFITRQWTDKKEKLDLDVLAEELLKIKHMQKDAANVSNKASVFKVRNNDSRNNFSKTQEKSSKPPYPCRNCNQDHWIRDCPYKAAKCHKCHQTGHIAPACKTFSKSKANKKQQFKAQNVDVDDAIHLNSTIMVNTTKSQRSYDALENIIVKVNNVSTKFCIDTGSQVNIVSKQTAKMLKLNITPTKTTALLADNSTATTFVGEAQVNIAFNDNQSNEIIYVHPKIKNNLLGIGAIKRLNIIQLPPKVNAITSETFLENLQDKYLDVFAEGLGCIKTKASLILKKDVKPTFCRARPVPYAAVNAVDKELDRLINLNVIEPINYSDWAAPILVVKKPNNGIRICNDFSTGLNDALELHRHPLPVMDDIFATVNGATVFSSLDFSDAYLQVELDEESKNLAVINTHRGLFRFNRLCFGIKSAPGIFQQIMDQMLNGLDFAIAYLDDIIIASPDPESHRKHVLMVFDRIAEFGFKIKLAKCSFFKSSIKYLGFIIDKNGRRPDPDKIAAIQKMPRPENIAELRSFLGMINQYQKFIHDFKRYRYPLDNLLKKNQKFVWTQTQEAAFVKCKSIIASDLLLTHYDPKLPLVLAADASEVGIGGVLQHEYPDGSRKAIIHISRSLTTTEKNYSQTEKEGLALVFAVKKLHKMLYGRKFLLKTDHQALLQIFKSKKGINPSSSSRLQRWASTLLGYDFTLEYVKTTNFGEADCLSRLIAAYPKPEDEDVIIANLNLMHEFDTSALPVKFSDVQDSIKQDKLLQQVITFTLKGWPNIKTLKELHYWNLLLPYYRRRDALSIEKGCLFCGNRLVIPQKLITRLLKCAHQGHPGIERMKVLLRAYAFWPSMNDVINQFVKNCKSCSNAARMPIKTNLEPWPAATTPWQRVHMDYAGPFKGHYFLIIVDAFSKWPEVHVTKNIDSVSTINLLKKTCITHGFPEVIVTDNGPQFKSKLFNTFCSIHGITHITSAPYMPMSNGQAERFVDTFKRGLRKCEEEEGDVKVKIDLLLLNYRSTPLTRHPEHLSPAELLMGRKLRTGIALLRPPSSISSKNKMMQKQFNQKHGTRYREFCIGTAVFVKQGTKSHWIEGEIIKKLGKVMYKVMLKNGQSITAHTNQMRLDESISPLLNTFGFTDHDNITEHATTSMPSNTTPDDHVPPPRRSTRISKPPQRLNVRITSDKYYN